MSYLLLVPGDMLKKYWVFKHMDKFAHFTVFFIWSGLVTFALELGDSTKNIYWKVIAGALFFGGSVELAQMIIPNRRADWFDMIMNMTGTIVGYFIADFLKNELFGTEKKFDK